MRGVKSGVRWDPSACVCFKMGCRGIENGRVLVRPPPDPYGPPAEPLAPGHPRVPAPRPHPLPAPPTRLPTASHGPRRGPLARVQHPHQVKLASGSQRGQGMLVRLFGCGGRGAHLGLGPDLVHAWVLARVRGFVYGIFGRPDPALRPSTARSRPALGRVYGGIGGESPKTCAKSSKQPRHPQTGRPTNASIASICQYHTGRRFTNNIIYITHYASIASISSLIVVRH